MMFRNGSVLEARMRWALVAGVLVCAAAVSLTMWHLSANGDLEVALEWVRANKIVGGVVYIIVFASCIVACLPATMFELAAGYLFGFAWGWVLATTGKTLGSVVSFALGRYYLQGWVHKMMSRGPPIFRALAQLISKNELKWKIVILTRIAWMPIAIKNYGLSVLPVSFALFFWPMLIVGAVFTAISVYLGQTITHMSHLVAGDSGGSTLKLIVMIAGGASAFALVGILGYHTRRHLEEMAKGSDMETDAAKIVERVSLTTQASDSDEDSEEAAMDAPVSITSL
ncbi:Aste57867_1375 [Aphanomyces stellatus]|uniref:Aste57867_1375 protein n=1 Tax=Aphanomyces stellatus TaxID=120398 RepID=A0A485KAH5_9STRA|nr:hypothetical protein As57867_001374 [Aphanomyces stellatus]VFT78593.1 Aste57867_1375 [Aphanomyces stellatus]